MTKNDRTITSCKLYKIYHISSRLIFNTNALNSDCQHPRLVRLKWTHVVFESNLRRIVVTGVERRVKVYLVRVLVGSVPHYSQAVAGKDDSIFDPNI